MEELRIKGKVLKDRETLEKYSVDKSPYKIRPRLVAIPKDEEDVVDVVDYAKRNSIPITARAAGSNVSGSAVGSGIVVDFSAMNAILWKKGRRVRIQPGVIYDHLNEKMKKYGLWLPYSPGSGAFCTVGGNFATKASGLRGVKYGSVDKYVRGVRFVTMEHGVVDTKQALPTKLEKVILSFQRKLISDDNAMSVLKRREKLKTSTGYNLSALYKYEDLGMAVSHLLVGSVGTLGLITEIELELVPLPKRRMTCVGFFENLEDASKTALRVTRLGPSAIEMMDSGGAGIVRDILGMWASTGGVSLLLIEFDDNLAEAKVKMRELFQKNAVAYAIETSPHKQEKIWDARESALLRLSEEESPNKKHLAFVDDLGVPVKRLPEFLSDVEKIFKKNKTEYTIYGHAGEGNIHFRPSLARRGWRSMIKRLAEMCVKTTFKYGGTVAGEHGSGRNRAPYMEDEWGNEVFGYFRELKRIFDRKGLLNPGAMFSKDDITEHMKY